jgi:amyloid beta precursor protein binding protein 1
VSTQFLLELNPDVRGDYIDEGPEQILINSPDFFNNFNVVIACAISEK